ncbi:MAG: DivIVA domain-containing protein, partial [Propionibacteriaceae bacterium]|nr:DivIVA domain-containing protein [Propionibacteriaceae bacterium]
MTLTVDEVRNVRFPMARQPNEDGYRASAVDNF